MNQLLPNIERSHVDLMPFMKSGINKSWTKAILKRWYDVLAVHSINVLVGFNTASWRYTDNKHVIHVGDGIFARSTGKDDILLIQSYLFHELAHGLWTERDIKGLFNSASDMGIDSSLLNLAEDARIEHLFRQMAKGFKFNWLSLENVTVNHSPKGMLFQIICHEGGLPVLEHRSLNKVMAVVYRFYQSFITCKSTNDLLPILLEWVALFEDDANGDCDDSLKDAIKQSNKHSSKDNFESDLNADIEGFESINAISGDDASENNDDEPIVEHSLLLDCGIDFDRVTVDKCAMLLKSSLTTHSSYITTVRPSKQISVRNIIRGEKLKVYRRKSAKSVGDKSINLVIDCSGSMRGQPIINAQLLVAIFSNLSKVGVVRGNVILSSTACQPLSLSLPVSDDTISKLANVRGGEGLSDTFTVHKDVLGSADINFIITDGYLSDRPINKSLMHKWGINTYGLYVGNDVDDSDLLKWFDMACSRSSLEELISVMCRVLKLIA